MRACRSRRCAAGCSRHRHADAWGRGECGMREARLRGQRGCSQYLGDMTAGRQLAGHDRVLQRRQAVAPARHFREAEGLSIAQIAARLGRSPATVKAYFYDPTGAKARAVKARCQGVRRGAARTRSRGTERTPSRTARRSLRCDRAALDARARAGSAAPGGPATGWWTCTSATLIRLRRRASPSGPLFPIVPCGRGP